MIWLRLNVHTVLLFPQDRSNAMDDLLEVERLQVIDFALEQQNAVKNGMNHNSNKKGGKKSKAKYVGIYSSIHMYVSDEFLLQSLIGSLPFRKPTGSWG